MIDHCSVHGIKISYEIRGEGEPLVLLMGLGAPGSKWEPHIQAYERHFQTIAIDNRGSGRSDRPRADIYTIEDMAKDAIGVMDHLGIESAHFNGISMGGAIAQHVAIHYPQRVRSLILTNTLPYCSVSFRRAIELLRDANGVLDRAHFTRLLQWIIYASEYQQHNEHALLEAEKADAEYEFPMPSYAFNAQCNGLLQHNALQDLQKIHAPVLVAAGDADLFIPPWHTMEMMDALPNAEIYMCKGGGHVQHWEQPEAYNRVTLDFLLKNRTLT